jgi:hypothetical protein
VKDELKAVAIAFLVAGIAFVATSRVDLRASVAQPSYLYLEWPRSMSDPLITLVAGNIPAQR